MPLLQSELETVVSWFMYHMPMDQRYKFMAELPQHYAKLCPSVAPERIAGIVQTAIESMRATS